MPLFTMKSGHSWNYWQSLDSSSLYNSEIISTGIKSGSRPNETRKVKPNLIIKK
jgi:hypothetical protein